MMEGGLRTRGVIKSSTPSEPLLSIITVVFNGAVHIERAFESVLIQDYANIEYIVVDGGSSDGTVEIIKGHENIIDFWISEPDNGIYDAMNKGVVISKGDLIGFLNSDDYYEPGSIKEVITAYLEAGCRGIYFGNSFVIQEDLGIRYLSVGKPSLWRGLGFKHQAMFVHRYVHQQHGLYNAAYRIAADYDFVMNAASKGVRLVHINKYLVNYSNTGVSGINRTETLSEIRMISRGYYGRFSLPYLGFMLVFMRSCLFQAIQKLICYIFGEKILLAVRLIYTRLKYKRLTGC